MSSAYLGQVMLFAGPFAPRGWHFCDGSVQQIQQYTALYSLLGTQYGGDGTRTFNLPDLRGRVAVGAGSGQGLSPWTPGQQNGAENVTLSTNQIPSHNHTLVATGTQGADISPANDYLAPAVDTQGVDVQTYSKSLSAVNMATGSIGQTGGNQAHTNIQPSLGMNYIICMEGIYPSRN